MALSEIAMMITKRLSGTSTPPTPSQHNFLGPYRSQIMYLKNVLSCRDEIKSIPI